MTGGEKKHSPYELHVIYVEKNVDEAIASKLPEDGYQ